MDTIDVVEQARAKAELGLQTLLGLCSLSMYGFGADPVKQTNPEIDTLPQPVSEKPVEDDRSQAITGFSETGWAVVGRGR